MLLLYFGPAALGIVDHLRCRFARFKLSAHFLKARGQGLNLLFLQSDHCRLSFSCGLQFLHNALLFEQLVCRQRRLRGGNAKLAVCSYDNRDTGDWYTRDIADKAAIVHVRAHRAYGDNVIGGGDATAGSKSQRRVITGGGDANASSRSDGRVPREIGREGDTVLERAKTDGRVEVAINVSLQRPTANCRVIVRGAVSARVIEKERFIADGRVARGVGIVKKRAVTDGVVAGSVDITKERKGADSVGELAVIVIFKRGFSIGRVGVAGGVNQKRSIAGGRVGVAIGVVLERSGTNGRVKLADDVVGERFRPNGHVLEASGVPLKRPRTNRHVKTAGGVVGKRISTHG